MMRYLLFAGHNYYPKGGISDLRAQAETVDELKQYFVKHAEHIADGSYIDNWCQIVDRDTLSSVLEGTVRRRGEISLLIEWSAPGVV